MHPAAFAADALFYSSKAHPTAVDGKWAPTAAIAPAGARASANELPPSAEAAILQFTSNEVARLQLPVSPQNLAVEAVHMAWEQALLAATPAAEAGLKVPISTVEHENDQLTWTRPGVPPCRFANECDACRLPHAPGPLPVYLSIDEQDAFDRTGEVPPGSLFCLLCIRRDCQALFLAHCAATKGDLACGHTTFCVPPFQNLVDCPGGYHHAALSVPPSHAGTVPITMVGVSPHLRVLQHPFTGSFFVDQGPIVFGAQLNRLPAVL